MKEKIKKKNVNSKLSLHSCPHCPKHFDNSRGLQNHLKIHSTSLPYHCELCDYKARIKKYLTRHVKKTHTKPTGNKCEVCGKCFHFQSKLRGHMRVHTGEKPFKCPVCDKAFRSTYTLSVHKMIHTGEKPYRCQYCDYACRDTSTIRKHVERHLGLTKDYPCSICKKNFKKKETLQIHVDEVHFELDTRKFPCSQCEKVFKTKGTLTAHNNTVHRKDRNRIDCEICNANVTKNNIQAHMRRHVDVRPYKCSYRPCGKTFKVKGDLTKHSRIHYPDHQHQCTICLRRFPRRWRLNKHILLHEQGHRVQCDYCEEMFLTKVYLSKHIKSAHGPNSKKYVCDLCDMVTYSRRRITMHMRYGHGTEKETRCQICNKDFFKYNTLKEHYLKHHNLKYTLLGKKFPSDPIIAARWIEKEIFEIKQPSNDVHLAREHEVPIKEEPLDDMEAPSPPQFLYEVDIEKQEIDAEFSTPVLRLPSPENYFIDADTITYSKKVMSEDISRSLIEREKMTQDAFDDFFIGHVMKKPEEVIELPKQIIDEKQKDRVDKCLDKLLSEVRIRKELKVLEKMRRQYNRRIKMATSGKKESKSIRYFKNPELNGLDDSQEEVDSEIETNNDKDIRNKNNRKNIENNSQKNLRKTNEINYFNDDDDGQNTGINGEINDYDEDNQAIDHERNSQCTEHGANVTGKTKNNKINDEIIDRTLEQAIDGGENEINNKINDEMIDKTIDQAIVSDENEINNYKIIDEIIDKAIDDTDVHNKDDDDINDAVNGDETVERNDDDDEIGDDYNKDIDYRESDEINSDEEINTNKNIKFNTHQCYICFKLFKTKSELKRHCKEHFDICNEKMLKKCPFCGYVTNLQITKHIKLVHDITLDIPYAKIKEKDTGTGSKYVFEIDKECDLEVIPSISNLNKIASMKIDKQNRSSKNNFLGTTKLVKKGNFWMVEKEAVKINNDHLLPEFTDKEYQTLKSIGDTYLERLRNLSILGKKKGVRILYPCDGCDKICLTFSALKLHNRKHEANPKCFKPKVWKNKILNGIGGVYKNKNKIYKNKNRKKQNDVTEDSDTKTTNNNKTTRLRKLERVNNKSNKIANRFAEPNPVKNKHKCSKELIEFYENNIKGGDIEFWQFLKIFNKMSRENVNDFKDLENRYDFGMHVNLESHVVEPKTMVEEVNAAIVDNSQAIPKKTRKIKKKSFTRSIMISKKEYLRRKEIKNLMRKKLATCTS